MSNDDNLIVTAPPATPSWSVDDAWELIKTAADPTSELRKAMDARAAIEAKYLVNGNLLITHKQYMELARQEADKPLPLLPSPMTPRADSIPVIVVRENGQPVDVGNNQVAFIGFDRCIYVVTRDHYGPVQRDG
jgi:hypothetical protein